MSGLCAWTLSTDFARTLRLDPGADFVDFPRGLSHFRGPCPRCTIFFGFFSPASPAPLLASLALLCPQTPFPPPLSPLNPRQPPSPTYTGLGDTSINNNKNNPDNNQRPQVTHLEHHKTMNTKQRCLYKKFFNFFHQDPNSNSYGIQICTPPPHQSSPLSLLSPQQPRLRFLDLPTPPRAFHSG